MALATLRLLVACLCASAASARFTAVSSSGAEYVDIGGRWHATNSNGSVSVPATVPGLIQTDLYAAGVLPDPLKDNNFELYNWVPQDNWTFSRALPRSSPKGKRWSAFKKVYLVFEGIDTAAQVRLDGHSVGFADNQFRQWAFDVTKHINKQSKLKLEVEIQSPIKYALDVMEKSGSPYTVFTNYNVEYPEGREYIRKVQSDFGWDWGPHFAPQGIYRDAYLVGLDDGFYVTNTFIDIYKQDQRPNTIPAESNQWVVNASVDFLSAGTASGPGLRVDVAGFHGSTSKSTVKAGANSVSTSFQIPDAAVERWWPKTFGSPVLYNASITLALPSKKPNESKCKLQPSAKYSKSVGFRTIVLDLTPYNDRPGDHFSFRINGHTFNTKGSNMVPTSPFEHQVTGEDYRRLVQSSVASNYNMIRVWASGNYYADELYDAADELGILLWSEFQFSDNFYPVLPEFLDTVREEARFQVRRLNHHASQALWCGGNEMAKYRRLAARNETYGESWARNMTVLQQDVLWPVVYENTRSVSWIQASDAQGYIKYDPAIGYIEPRDGTDSPIYGSSMDYNLGLDTVFDNSQMPVTRFVVEFGGMSYDSLLSYQTIFGDQDIRPDGDMLLNRCYDGGSTIYPDLKDGMEKYLILPNVSDPLKHFDQFSWTSQIWQGMIIKHKIESYRRSISLPENNLGSLVWQLNAPWTTLALNSIEHTGRWKVLQHVTKQTYEPVVASSWFESSNDTYRIWVASDAFEPVTGHVTATWLTWSGKQLATKTYNFSMPALHSMQIEELVGWKAILPAGAAAESSVLLLRVSAKGPGSGRKYSSENYWVPKYLSNSKIVDPGLKLDYLGHMKWKVTATKGVAAHVWLTAPKDVIGFFDDNSIFLAKGESRTFTFTVQEGPKDGGWLKDVSVRSIWDNVA
ncbi:glycoside hydrolase family 2 protein [Purpureocillium lavendulum]|uniref:Beta-mannosidase A n=1 Tax=Purpureocillium lavendulum TaxID=1247861 RepID=A0AB34FVX9_9HYPO|nr:glycoside hydrolase family 2 protein [Purpureocillium lavendulum]